MGSNSQAATRPSMPISATLAPDVPRSTARMYLDACAAATMPAVLAQGQQFRGGDDFVAALAQPSRIAGNASRVAALAVGQGCSRMIDPGRTLSITYRVMAAGSPRMPSSESGSRSHMMVVRSPPRSSQGSESSFLAYGGRKVMGPVKPLARMTASAEA